ncbi:MAG: carboxylesterase family protein [Robiginitomaculum sp.]|nr:carboxylesterase family protein [Robiginitomaculum sp.]
MKNLTLLLVITAFISACQKPAADLKADVDLGTLRTIENGQIAGSITDNGNHRWAGIAFAKPPVGNLRWRAPRKPDNWEDVFHAVDASARCPQKARSTDADKIGKLVGSEDCLYLNVWAPAFTKEQIPQGENKLPVMVFIHGGSNVWGYGGQYDSQYLSARHDLIVVTINYRLGPLGWFFEPSLQQDNVNPDDNSPNFANLDMIAALQWVQKNVSAFGGDPNRVTIFGESAGGHNVASLMAMPRAQGLFHGAIIQSGYFTSRSITGQQQGVDEDYGWEFKGDKAIIASLAPSPEASGYKLADFLRDASVKELFAAAAAADGEPGSPLIIRDGILIPRAGLESALENSEHEIVPFITGTNRDELKLFNIADKELMKKAFGVLPRARDPELYNLISNYQSAMWRARSVDEQAIRISQRNQNPVYAYRFDWDEEGSFLGSDFSQLLGAAHAMEIPFIFDGFEQFPIGGERIFPKAGANERDQLSAAMMSYWAEFAYTGNPGKGRNAELEIWNSWSDSPAEGQLIIFDTLSGGGTRMNQQVISSTSVYQSLGKETAELPGQTRCIILQSVISWFPETNDMAKNANIRYC